MPDPLDQATSIAAPAGSTRHRGAAELAVEVVAEGAGELALGLVGAIFESIFD